MKILKYVKKKNNTYNIYLDDNTMISLYDDVILKSNLLLTKSITNKELVNIIKDNDYYDAYYKSIKYISRKQRSKEEIRKYLKDYDIDIINKVIDRLTSEKYINEEIYIESYIHDAVTLTNKGYYKIYNELDNLKLDNELIYKYLNKVDKHIWYDKANKIVEKKLKANNNYSSKKLLNKIKNDLYNLGYTNDIINNIVDSINIEDNNHILEKQYNKLYNRLSKKYSDEELNNQIIRKLLNMGFDYENIKNTLK